MLDLPPGMEVTLAREAAQHGTTPELLALDGLRRLFPAADNAPKTGADLLALWERQGAFLPREDLPDSPELALQLREQAQHERDALWERP